MADISAALFWRAKCCVKAALVAPLATPANWKDDLEEDSFKKPIKLLLYFYARKGKNPWGIHIDILSGT